MKGASFRHEFEAIFIVRLERIMRSLANFAPLNQELTAAKVGPIYIEQQIDTTTPAGRLQQNILAAFAEYEREAIRERVLDGIARARSEGKKLGRPTVSDEKASERTLRRRKAEAKKGGSGSLYTEGAKT
jgi:DNA invertase Pin-like site-specific DNA recombinase